MDIFFIDKELFPFSELLVAAKRKQVGLDDYWLAIAMMKVEELGPLPRMVKPLVVDEMLLTAVLIFTARIYFNYQITLVIE